MTRILLRPHELPRFGPTGGSRVLLEPPWQWWRTRLLPCPDGTLFHQQYDDPRDIREASILFHLLDVDEEIVNPPALHLWEHSPEYQDVGFGVLDRVMMTRGPTAECEVVWHEQPGERWMMLPGNTCRPGDYEIGMVDRTSRMNNDSTTSHYCPGMPTLRWPWRSPVERLEGLVRDATVALGRIGVPSGLDEYMQTVFQAYQEFRTEHRQNPAAILMSREDCDRLRRTAQQEGYASGPPVPGRPYDTLLGIEVRVDSDMPPGRVLIVGREGYAGSERSVGIFQQQHDIRELEAGPAVWSGRRHVLNPEDNVLDEIDLLVNDQVRPGPQDDYRVNRYPKCTHCGCDWHGILCKHCACLGELEDEC